jgi:hypothetical protein
LLLIGLAGSFSPGARSSTFVPAFLRTEFTFDIDAVVWDDSNHRIDFFKGGDYIGVFATSIRAVGTNKINGDWMPFPTPRSGLILT